MDSDTPVLPEELVALAGVVQLVEDYFNIVFEDRIQFTYEYELFGTPSFLLSLDIQVTRLADRRVQTSWILFTDSATLIGDLMTETNLVIDQNPVIAA